MERGGGRRGRGRARGRGGRGGAVALGKRPAGSASQPSSKVRLVSHMLLRALYFEDEHILDLVNLAEERLFSGATDEAPYCEEIVTMFYMLCEYVATHCREVDDEVPEVDENFEDDETYDENGEPKEVRITAMSPSEKDDAYNLLAKVIYLKRIICSFEEGVNKCTFAWSRIEKCAPIATLCEKLNQTDAMSMTQTQMRSVKGVDEFCVVMADFAKSLHEMEIPFPKPFELDIIIKMKDPNAPARPLITRKDLEAYWHSWVVKLQAELRHCIGHLELQ